VTVRLKTLPKLRLVLIVLGCALSGGCATNPARLAIPDRMTCIHVPSLVETVEPRGLVRVRWRISLRPGPYVSEYADSSGTYYRAPPGGVYMGLAEPGGSTGVFNQTYDGGLWVPHDPAGAPRVYSYFSTQSAEVRSPAEGATCANATYAERPDARGVSAIQFALGGGLGGGEGGAQAAAGGTVGFTERPSAWDSWAARAPARSSLR